ncbi:TlpA family protein disulfide reductase [Chitinophaga sp. 30R24]|uniref:TlpA family protein disulfide reductase n=1 Tax=Chitinophaga sp. 30R24 TaxID=3248838 RepID=UPI003B91A42D
MRFPASLIAVILAVCVGFNTTGQPVPDLPGYAAGKNVQPSSSWLYCHFPSGSNIKVKEISWYMLLPGNSRQQVMPGNSPDTLIALQVDHFTDIYLELDNDDGYEVTVLPGDTLHIYFGKDNEDLAFSGKAAALNELLQHKAKFLGYRYSSDVSWKLVETVIPLDSCFLAFDHYYQVEQDFLREHGKKLLPVLYQRELAIYVLRNKWMKLRAASWRNIPPESSSYTAIGADNAFLMSVSKYTATDPVYYLFLQYLFWGKIPGKNDLSFPDAYEKVIPILRAALRDSTSLQLFHTYWITFNTKIIENRRMLKTYKNLYENCRRDITSPYLHTVISESLVSREKYLSGPLSLDSGMLAPSFALPDEAGKQVILEQFKGKWVYLDLWATWCTPCLKDIPAKNHLESVSGDGLLQIISVCIDCKYADWKQMLSDKKIAGINLFAEKKVGDEIRLKYKMQAWPHHVLIDPSGKVYENATYPPSNFYNFFSLLSR